MFGNDFVQNVKMTPVVRETQFLLGCFADTPDQSERQDNRGVNKRQGCLWPLVVTVTGHRGRGGEQEDDKEAY